MNDFECYLVRQIQEKKEKFASLDCVPGTHVQRKSLKEKAIALEIVLSEYRKFLRRGVIETEPHWSDGMTIKLDRRAPYALDVESVKMNDSILFKKEEPEKLYILTVDVTGLGEMKIVDQDTDLKVLALKVLRYMFLDEYDGDQLGMIVIDLKTHQAESLKPSEIEGVINKELGWNEGEEDD